MACVRLGRRGTNAKRTPRAARLRSHDIVILYNTHVFYQKKNTWFFLCL